MPVTTEDLKNGVRADNGRVASPLLDVASLRRGVSDLRADNGRVARPRRRPGMIDGALVERLLILLIHIAAWGLIVLSILGTFYGSRGLAAPILQPWQITLAIVAQPWVFVGTVVLQVILSVVQWGARQMARRVLLWWLLYFGALALSAWWNWQAYGAALLAMHTPWLLAIGVIIIGDMIPELALVVD